MNLNWQYKISDTIDNDKIIQSLLGFLCNFKDIKVYMVGGYIRDIILDIVSTDKDYVIIGDSAINIAQKVADYLNGYFVLLDKTNEIARVVLPDKENYLDFSSCAGNSICEDLSRRDFSINSIAYDFQNRTIIDPYNGYISLIKKNISAISEKNIIDDPLRILRAFRIAALIEGNIDDVTLIYIKRHFRLLKNVSVERIQVELNKLLANKKSFKYLNQLSKLGILELIFPQISELKDVTPNVYHHLNLFEHTLEVYNQVEYIIREFSEYNIKNTDYTEKIFEKTLDHLDTNISPSINRTVALKYAALFHDISKPQTWNISEDDKHTFIGHPEEGAVLTEQILKNLKLSNASIKVVKKLVKYHLYPSQLANNTEIPTTKAISRLFRKLDKELPELIILSLADRRSAKGPLITEDIIKKNESFLLQTLKSYYESLDKIETLPKLLNGNDVINILQLSPSPEVGKILKEIRDLQLEGKINTIEEAINWLKNYKSL